jgi:hypothetical protein
MPRGSPPQWRQRKPPVLDAWILASVREAGGQFDAATGRYKTLRIAGLADRAEAREYIRALHRSGVFLTKYAIADVGIHAKIIRGDTGYTVEFAAVDKAMARKHIIETYGADRSKWPYDPRRKVSTNGD